MATIVVGGSGKGVGKTALVCGLIAALPEFAWTAVKVTSHEYGKLEPVWEETEAGPATDTARFLVAGARRAFLITATEAELPQRLADLTAKLDAGAHLIFESNRILQHLVPDLYLAVAGAANEAFKTSYREAAHHTSARVVPGACDVVVDGAIPLFQLAALESVSTEMQRWVRGRLTHA
jgi:hypothetical protein